jgi:hypothetical protein
MAAWRDNKATMLSSKQFSGAILIRFWGFQQHGALNQIYREYVFTAN